MRRHGLFLRDAASLQVLNEGSCLFDEWFSVHTVDEREARDNRIPVVAGFHDDSTRVVCEIPPEIGNALTLRGGFSSLQDGLLVLCAEYSERVLDGALLSPAGKDTAPRGGAVRILLGSSTEQA